MNIKRQSEILSDMIDYTSSITNKVTDFTVGSAVRSLFDAFSIELEMLYMLTSENIQEGIDAGLMSAFDFSPKEAQKAYGNVTIEFYNPLENAISIDKGTRFSTSSAENSIYFEADSSYIVPEGSSEFTLSVICNVPGEDGNVVAGEISNVETSLYNVSKVYNTSDILTGRKEETYEEAKSRFQLFIESRGRATKKSVLYGALSVPEVNTAYIEEQTGLVNVYVADDNGNLTQSLQQKVIDALEDYRPAAIKLNVFPMLKKDLDIDATVYVDDISYITDSYREALLGYIKGYLNQFKADKNFIVHDLIKTVINFDDDTIIDVDIDTPAGNYITNPDEIIRAGVININFVEVNDA